MNNEKTAMVLFILLGLWFLWYGVSFLIGGVAPIPQIYGYDSGILTKYLTLSLFGIIPAFAVWGLFFEK